MGVLLVPVEIMAVVGGHQRQVQFPGQFFQPRVDHPLFRQAVFLKFQVKAVAKDLLQGKGRGPGLVQAVWLGQEIGNLAVQTGGEADKPLAVPGQDLLVDPRFVVEALQLGDGGQLDKVLVAGAVHGQQHEVEGGAAGALGRFAEAIRHRDVELAADNGFQPMVLGLAVKLQGAVHGAVVGDGHRLHAAGLAFVEQVGQADGAVQQAVLGMDVQVDKGVWHILAPG